MATVKERHPEVYIEHDEDPLTRQRTVPMEVLSLGFSRTGTMTMKAALEILGIPTWHWVTMSSNPRDLSFWGDAMEAKLCPSSSASPDTNLPLTRETFDHLLGYWGACTDQPAALFAPELIAAYPEAKVILVERDPEKWYASFASTVIAGVCSPFVPFAALIDPGYMGQMARQADLIARYYFHVTVPRQRNLRVTREFGDAYRAKAKTVYMKHNETVRAATPPERLLVMDLGQGWEPLCRFLGRPVPDSPFPRVNETKAVQEKVNAYIAESFRRSAVRSLKTAGPVVLVGVVGLVAWRMA